MDKFECLVCGYIYDPEEGDPENGIEPGTSFEDIPEDWLCPLCGAGKEEFEKVSWASTNILTWKEKENVIKEDDWQA